MDFLQKGPELTNIFESDVLLQAYLQTQFSSSQYAEIEKDLKSFGEKAATRLLALAEQAEREEPEHIPYDPWGKRIDDIRVSPAWKELHKVSAEEGLIAIGYERKWGSLSRLYQFAKLYLFHSSSAFYSCPLAMADGAARVLELESKSDSRFKQAFEHLTSRDPQHFWTSGQWMTEKTGGSDVSGTQTVARAKGDAYELEGIKWFSSATTSEMALGLARIEGAPEGSKGLSLFYIPMRDADGRLNGIEVLRLKDKLGTKALPTAELRLKGTKAWRVGPEGQGVKWVATMLNITRLYNSICSVSQMRRALSLSYSYSEQRKAFGDYLENHPLHLHSLAGQQKLWAKAGLLTWQLSRLLGQEELGENSAEESILLRLLTPVAKLWTAKQCLAITSEAIESFGGAGYVEDTQLPVLLRNAQVFPIWEGTTNVLSLDVLRVVQKEPEALQVYLKQITQLASELKSKQPEAAVWLERERDRLGEWLDGLKSQSPQTWQFLARDLAYRLAELISTAWVCKTAVHEISPPAVKALAQELVHESLTPLPQPESQTLQNERQLIF